MLPTRIKKDVENATVTETFDLPDTLSKAAMPNVKKEILLHEKTSQRDFASREET